MMLSTLTLLIDFGMVVLIWMVQLIIYPSFHVVAVDDFGMWHQKYMSLISLFVIPLMFAQVACHGLGLYREVTVMGIVAALCIAAAWGTTFFLSVPCHNTLTSMGKSADAIQRLIDTNWPRTILWSLTFIVSATRFKS